MKHLRIATILAIAALTASVSGCGSDGEPTTPPSPGKPDKVTVGVIPIVDVAPIYLGKQQGFFSKRNIDLTMETAQGGAAIVPAVVSGQYQFGFSNVVSLMVAQENNVPIKAVANGVYATGDPAKDFSGLIVKDPNIKSAKDLEGKTVASNTLKNIVDTSIKELVRKDGGDPAKVKLVELPFPDMAAALDGDRVQATFVVEPFLSAALAKGWRSVGSFAAVDPNLCVAMYFTSTRLASENADLVRRFTEAMNESLAYADANPQAVVQIITTYTQITPDAAAKMTLPKFPAEINRSALENLSSLLVANEVLKAPAELNKLLP
jgi:NitT/TauT family transport system substrate-binding protein